MFFREDEEFFEFMTSFISLSDNQHLGFPIDYLQGPNCSIDAPSNSGSLGTIIISSQIGLSLVTNIDYVESNSMVIGHSPIRFVVK
jgi:hypothetical protein